MLQQLKYRTIRRAASARRFSNTQEDDKIQGLLYRLIMYYCQRSVFALNIALKLCLSSFSLLDLYSASTAIGQSYAFPYKILLPMVQYAVFLLSCI